MELKLEVFIPNLKLSKREDQSFVFDPCRSKYVLFTEEEMIRQLLIQFFLLELKIPRTLISVERSFKINNLLKRYDIIVHSSHQLEPILMVEVKRADVKIDQTVLDQINVYNIGMEAPYLLVSNGIQNILMESQSEQLKELRAWPEELLQWKVEK